MRVLVVMPGITPDAGAEQSFVATAPLLLEAGVDLHLALLTDRQTLVPELEQLGVTVHDRSGDGQTLLARARAVRSLVRMLRPDLVHAVLLDATLPTQLGLIGVDVPLLVTWAATHQLDPEAEYEDGAARWKLGVIRWAELLLGRATRTRYHAVTEGTAESCRRVVRASASSVRVAERGRPAAPYASSSGEDVRALRSELGVGEAEHLVLAIGRQEPQKGFDTLLEVAAEVVRLRSDVVVAVAGREGRATPHLQQRLAELGPSVRVRFLGHRDDVPDLLQAADVVVCTSRREGAAGALLEAMAAGRPIVAIPLTGLRGVLSDGLDALVVPKGGMARALAILLDDDDRRRALGAAARATYEARFTAERAAAAMLDLYRWAVGQVELIEPGGGPPGTNGDRAPACGAAPGTPAG